MIVYTYTANQEPACLLTQLLTMTATHKFPSLGEGVHGGLETGLHQLLEGVLGQVAGSPVGFTAVLNQADEDQLCSGKGN